MLQFNTNSKERAVRRLSASGVDFEAADAHWEVRSHGVELGGFVSSADGNPDFVFTGRVGVRRCPVLVTVNPAISKVLGYQPGCATLLTAGFEGQLSLTFRDFEDRELVQRLNPSWIVQLSVLPWASME